MRKDFGNAVSNSFNPFEVKKRGDSSLLMLDPKELLIIEDQLVPGYTLEELKDLSSSIKENGVLESLVVRKKEEGKYEVLSGRNRCKAAIMAGCDKVPCHVVDVDDIKAELIMYDANFERREDIPLSVKVRVYKRKYELMTKDGGSRLPEKMAEEMGISRASVFRYLKLGKLKEELLPLLDEGKLNNKAAMVLADFPEEEQEKIMKASSSPSDSFLKDVKKKCEEGIPIEEALKPKKKKEKVKTVKVPLASYVEVKQFLAALLEDDGATDELKEKAEEILRSI